MRDPRFGRLPRSLRTTALAGLLLASGACHAMVNLRSLDAAAPGRTTYHQVKIGGRTRRFVLHLPPQADSGRVPLVLLFHGHGGSGALIHDESQMDDEADRRGVAVAYPDGTGRFGWFGLAWNVSNCCGWAEKHKVDDVDFSVALIDTLARRGFVDTARVAAAGFSAGGMLALRLACMHPERIAAAVDLQGAMPDTACVPSRGVPVMLLRGADDDELRHDLRDLVRRHGRSERFAHSMESALAFWARENACTPELARDSMPKYSRERAVGCPPGHAAELVTVYDHEHAWPGSEKIIPIVGPHAADLDGASLVLDFVGRYGVGVAKVQ